MQKHKILAFLLALFVSIGLWVYAVTVVNPNGTADIKGVRVRLVGLIDLQNRKLMLTEGAEQYVNVSVSGRRSDLKELNSSSLEAIADVSNIDAPGEYDLSWTLDPPSTVASGDIKLVDTNSNKITIKVSEYRERPEVPITVEYSGTLADGYIRDTETTGTLSVSGPAEEVSLIDHALVQVDLEGVGANIDADYPYTFVDADGAELTLSENVTVSSETVHLSVPILHYKQVELRVKLIDGGGATSKEVDCSIEPKTIAVTGSEEALAALDYLEVMTVDLAKVTESTTWDITPELPAGVTNRASDTNVKIRLRFVGLMTKRITFPCAEIMRQNDAGALEFAEQSVVISVRGKASEVNVLNADNILVSADMTDGYDATTKTVTLKIKLPDGSKAGVISEPYTVQVVDAG